MSKPFRVVLAFLCAGIGQQVQGLPLANTPVVITPAVDDHASRTTWNIICSCAATIFACTWVATHPNIPGAADRWFNIFFRRLKITFFALLAPELIVAWAMRQWLASRRLARTPLFERRECRRSSVRNAAYPYSQTDGRRRMVFSH